VPRNQGRQHWPFLVALMFVAAAVCPSLQASFGLATTSAAVAAWFVVSMLVVGALFRDEFAWLLRLCGAPLIVLGLLAGMTVAFRFHHPAWYLPSFVAALVAISWACAMANRMRLYQLATLVVCTLGLLGILAQTTMAVIQDSDWKGAGSFSLGIGWLLMAVLISSWKAGWLNAVGPWLGDMLTLDDPNLVASER